MRIRSRYKRPSWRIIKFVVHSQSATEEKKTIVVAVGRSDREKVESMQQVRRSHLCSNRSCAIGKNDPAVSTSSSCGQCQVEPMAQPLLWGFPTSSGEKYADSVLPSSILCLPLLCPSRSAGACIVSSIPCFFGAASIASSSTGGLICVSSSSKY